MELYFIWKTFCWLLSLSRNPSFCFCKDCNCNLTITIAILNKNYEYDYIYSGIHKLQLYINGTFHEWVTMLDLTFLETYDFILNQKIRNLVKRNDISYQMGLFNDYEVSFDPGAIYLPKNYQNVTSWKRENQTKKV